MRQSVNNSVTFCLSPLTQIISLPHGHIGQGGYEGCCHGGHAEKKKLEIRKHKNDKIREAFKKKSAKLRTLAGQGGGLAKEVYCPNLTI